MPERFYDPRDWFWKVGDGPAGQVYASARSAYVDELADAPYLAHLADGAAATVIDTAANLRAELAKYGIQYLGQALPPLEEERPRTVLARVRLVAASFSVAAVGQAGNPRSIPWSRVVVDPLGMWGGPAPAPNPERVLLKRPGLYEFRIGARFTEPVAATGFRALSLRRGLGGSPEDLGTGHHACAPTGNTAFNFTEYIENGAVNDVLRGFIEHSHATAINAVARLDIKLVE